MNETARSLVALALAHAERGDALGAAALLRAVVELPAESAPAALPHAESYAAFGARIGVSARTVRALVRRLSLPTMGNGRGRRVLVAEALAALRMPTTSTEDAGRAYVERRRLRVVGAT